MAGPRDEREERRPLLHDETTLVDEEIEDHDEIEVPAFADPRLSRVLRVAVPCVLIIFFYILTAMLVMPPMLQMAEGAVCQRMYREVTDPYNDPKCKDKAVQQEFAFIQGWDVPFQFIPGIVMAVPYGLMADKYGPKVVLLLVFLGQVLTQSAQIIIAQFPRIFSPRLSWASSLINFIGGGPIGFGAIRLAMAAQYSTESQRATVFLFVMGVTSISILISGPITYYTMQFGPLFAVMCALSLVIICAVLTLTLPDVRKAKTTEEEPELESGNSFMSIYKQRWAWYTKHVALVFRDLFKNNVYVGMLLVSLVFTAFGEWESRIRPQYVVDRYGWAWKETGFLDSIGAAVQISMTMLVLPAISWVLIHKLKVSSLNKDLFLARASLFVLIVGSFLVALAPSTPSFLAGVVVYELGAGYFSMIASVIASLAGNEHQSLLYMCIQVMKSTGAVVASPGLAAVFGVGLEWGKAWYGLPFLVAGCISLVSFSILMFARQRTPA